MGLFRSYCKTGVPFVPSFFFVDLWAYKNAARIFYYHNICFYVTRNRGRNNIISLQPKTITDFFQMHDVFHQSNLDKFPWRKKEKKRKVFFTHCFLKVHSRTHSVFSTVGVHQQRTALYYLSKVASSTAKYMKGERRKTFHASYMSKEIQKVEKNTKIQNHQFGLRDYFPLISEKN